MSTRSFRGRRAAILIAASAVGASSVAGAADWPSLGLDAGRRRATPEVVTRGFASASWFYALPKGAVSVASPAVADGFVVFGAFDGIVRALRVADGTVAWEFKLGDALYATPAIAAGKVFMPSTDQNVYALRLRDGALVWKADAGGNIQGSPVVDTGELMVTAGFPRRSIVELDLGTGKSLRRRAPPAFAEFSNSSIALSADIGVVGANGGHYYGIDRATLAPVWTYEAPGVVNLSAPTIVDGRAYFFPAGPSTQLHAVDLTTGVAVEGWPLALPVPPAGVEGMLRSRQVAASSIAVAGDVLLLDVRFDDAIDTTGKGTVDRYALRESVVAVSLSAGSGGVLWSFDNGRQIVSDLNLIPKFWLCPTPAVFSGAADGAGLQAAVASTLTSDLVVLDVATGAVRSRVGAHAPSQGSPVVANGRLFVATMNGIEAFPATSRRLPAPPELLGVFGEAPATLRWRASRSPAKYRIRFDRDGEILESWEGQMEVDGAAGAAELTFPLRAGWTYTASARAQDHLGALSDWSPPFAFGAKTAPPISVAGRSARDLEEAMGLANPGDAVTLSAGTYRLAASLRVPPGVTVQGAGAGATIIDGAGLAAGLVVSGVANRVDDLTVRDAHVGISVQGGDVKVAHVVVADADQAGIDVAAGAYAKVENATLVNNGVAVRAAGAIDLQNSIVAGNAAAFSVGGDSAVTSRFNDYFANGDKVEVVGRGEDDLSEPVTFFDGASDFRLRGAQGTTDRGDPTTDVGDEPTPNGGRVNLGAFGGTKDAESSAPGTAAASPGGTGMPTSSSPATGAAQTAPGAGQGGCTVAGAAARGSLAMAGAGLALALLFARQRRRRPRRGIRRLTIGAGLLVLAAASPANAATVIWGGGTGSWSTGANWVDGVAPGAGDTASFTGFYPLDRSGWTITASTGTTPSSAKDGSWSTRFTTSTPAASGQWVRVDLGSAKTFSRIVLDDTGDGSDYPAAFSVYVSNDGSTWGSAVAADTGSSAIVTTDFSPQTARYLKIQLTAGSSSWWSIRELFVYGSASTDDTLLSRNGWSATASLNSANAGNAFDSSLSTRWDTGTNAASNQTFTLDMGAAATVSRVELSSYNDDSDYPPAYAIALSTDGSSFSTVATGSGAGAFSTAAFTGQSARYVKLTCTSAGSHYWSIHDLNVYGTPRAATFSSTTTVAAVTLAKGTLTQGTGAPLAVTGAFRQSGGTFTGANAALTLGGNLDLSGGTFTSTSDTFTIKGTFNKTGGTFTAGSGVVVLANPSAQSLGGSATFYDLRVEAPRETGLVAYFKLDETASPSADSSASGLSATWSGSTARSATVPSGPSFDDGSSLSLPRASAASFTAPAATQVTISAWVKASSAGTGACYPRIVNMPGYALFFAGSSGACWVSGDHANSLGFLSTRASSNGSWRTPASTITLNGTTWYHVAATYDSSSTSNRPTLYINGTAYVDNGSGASSPVWQQATPSGAQTSNAGTGYIGNDSNTGTTRDWDGLIDDVRVYNTILTSAQIASLAAGRYSGAGGGATTTLASNTTVANTFAIDNGTVATSSYALSATSSSALSYVNAGTLSVGSGAQTFSGGLTVQPQGALTLATSGGSVKIGSAKTLTIDGTLNASAATASIETAGAAGTYYAFQVGSTATATPTLNVTGLQVKNTDTNGLRVNANTGSVTTFTRFDNIAFSAGTGTRLLQIYARSLYLSSNGCTFDDGVASGTTTYNVTLTGDGTSNGETRALFGRASCATNRTPCASYKSDDDAAGSGAGANPSTNGAVVQFVSAAATDTAGTIVGFPANAFDWNTWAYYSTYAAFRDSSGTADRIYVRDRAGAAKYYWDTAAGEDIVGTPRWDTVGGVHYLYIGTSGGKIYRLIDDTTAGTLSPDTASPWNGAAYDCGCTITTPLGMDSNNLYWGGTLSGVSKLWTLGRNTKAQPVGSPLSTAATVSGAAPAVWSSGGNTYLYLGLSGAVSKIDILNQANLATNTNPGGSTAVNGRVTVLSSKVYAGDDNGYFWVLDAGANFGANSGTYKYWSYHDATNHASCGGVCGIKSHYVDTATGRVYFGDQDGHLYVVANGAAATGFPFRPGSSSDAFATSPIYMSGILVVGTTTGTLYVIDQNNGTGPAVAETYKFGASTQVSGVSYDVGSATFLVTTSDAGAKDGRLYQIAATDPTPAYK
jgi:outer membrane protein assembly factor BamB